MKWLGFVLVLFNLCGCGSGVRGSIAEIRPIEFRQSVRAYLSCDEMQADSHDRLENARLIALKYRGQVNWQESVAVSSRAQGDVLTNLQEKDVDEVDFAKVGLSQFYVISKSKLRVVDRATLSWIGSVDLGAIRDPELLLDGDRLAVVGESGDSVAPVTEVLVYDVIAGASPRLLKSFAYPGRKVEARQSGGHLILVLQSSLPIKGNSYDEPVSERPISVVDSSVRAVPCNRLYQPVANDSDVRMSSVVTRDLRDLERTESKLGFMGGTDAVYMTAHALYLAKSRYVAPASEHDKEWIEATAITAVTFDGRSGGLSDARYGLINGRIKDRWALKEVEQGGERFLSVATTTGWAPSEAENHLFVLGKGDSAQTFKSVSELHGFGRNEDIRAVRYVGATAYVVTFEKTDPLFAIDLSNPRAVKLAGELHVPGFSTYLHPTSPGRLVGIGYDATADRGFSWFQGVQISLFDVSNPTQMTRLSNEVIGTRGSASEAIGDAHAFFHDAESGLVAVPLVEMARPAGSHPSTYGNEVKFIGSGFYRASDVELVPVARVSHQDLLPAYCPRYGATPTWWQSRAHSPDIRRVFRADGLLVTVSDFGIRRHTVAAPEAAVASTLLVSSPEDCPVYW